MMRCYTCGEFEAIAVNTWSQDQENPEEFKYVSVCRNCDAGCGWEGGPLDRLDRIRRVFAAHDIILDRVAQGDGELHGPEFSVCVDWEEPSREDLHILAWSGSWPDPIEHDMGAMSNVYEAARYCAFLLAREIRYAMQANGEEE